MGWISRFWASTTGRLNRPGPTALREFGRAPRFARGWHSSGLGLGLNGLQFLSRAEVCWRAVEPVFHDLRGGGRARSARPPEAQDARDGPLAQAALLFSEAVRMAKILSGSSLARSFSQTRGLRSVREMKASALR